MSSKNFGQKGLAATNDLSMAFCVVPPEPEIDIAAAIQDCINESMAKLSGAIQNRTERLLETIASVDGTAGAANRRKI
jgi:hypothetical protein